MDGLNEPREPRKMIAPDEWEKFLQEFATRNRDRRARFDVFRSDGTTEEEAVEAHLEDVKLTENGDRKNVEIIRIDRSAGNGKKQKKLSPTCAESPFRLIRTAAKTRWKSPITKTLW